MGRFSRKFGPVYENLAANIFKFCEAMNFTPSWQQEELLEAVQKAQNRTGSNWIACKSGQGPGKTTCSAIIGLWRTLRFHKTQTIVTAPTMRQCREVWLTEAELLLENAPKWLQGLFTVTKTKVYIGKEQKWRILTVTSTKDIGGQGLHRPGMTVIIEEASGVSRPNVEQYKGTLSNADALLLMIGNPNVRDCAFFDCFYGLMAKRWKKLTFNAEETPHHIVNPQRNTDLAEEFGRDSDVYRIRVLGEFPLVDPNCVMGSDEVALCMDKSLRIPALQWLKAEKYGGGLARTFGLDFARMGGDSSVLTRRSGMAMVSLDAINHAEPIKLVRMAFRQQEQVGWNDRETLYVPDATGMGQGVLFAFYEAGKQVHEFHNHGVPHSSEFANKVTEGWFHMRGLVRKKNCYLLENHKLMTQLSNRQYFHNKKGQIIIETKDDYITRGHDDSPDEADSTIQAFYDCPFVKSKITDSQTSEHSVGSGADR